MFKAPLFALLSIATQTSFATEQACTKLSKHADSADDNYRPPLEAKVIGNKKLYFYTAPDPQCKIKKFVCN